MRPIERKKMRRRGSREGRSVLNYEINALRTVSIKGRPGPLLKIKNLRKANILVTYAQSNDNNREVECLDPLGIQKLI